MRRDEVLQQVVERAFPGAQILEVQALSGGVSSGAAAVQVALASGETLRLVARRPRRDTFDEVRAVVRGEQILLGRCTELGVPVPRPRFVDLETGTILLDYIEGAPDFWPRDPTRMIEQLAAALARIHALPLEPGLAFLTRRAQSADRLARRRPSEPDRSLQELELRALIGSLWPWQQHNADVLLHGDYWPGNVLWRDGELVALVDWEESEIGDPLSDVSIARLDLAWAFGESAMDLFTERYRELSRIDWRNLARWDLLTALRPMGKLARWAGAYPDPPIARPDIDEPHLRAVHRRFVARAASAVTA